MIENAWGVGRGISPFSHFCIVVRDLCYQGRLVLANSLFSLRDINLTLGLLPHRRQVVWLDSVGVETSRSGLKIRVRGYFSSELSLLLRHTDEPQLKRAKQLSMAAIPLCFEFFRCRVSTISIAVFCLQNLICLQK